jgi:exodeoxyribonuclease-3
VNDVRIATWNVNSVLARMPRLLDWLETAKPDVVCLQEIKCSADAFPAEPVAELGYTATVHGAGRWAGVAILARSASSDVHRGLLEEPGFLAEGALFEATEPRALGITCDGVRIWSVYVPNGREVGHPHFAYKLRWLAALRATAEQELARPQPWVVLGDFNIAPTDADVWDVRRFVGSTHVTPEERASLAALADVGLREVLPRPLKYDVAFTYWDYRQLSFPHNHGMRIDLAYGNDAFVTAVTDAYVDREARKGAGTSDHAPMVIDTNL